MKWLAITIVVLLVGFLGYWLVVLRDAPTEPEVAEVDPNALGTAPEPKPSQSIPPSLSEYSLEFGNLTFEHPDDWTLVEGADNSDALQIITLESPKDDQNYYYCVDFNEYGPGQTPDLKATDIKVAAVEPVTASGIGKALNGVFYQVGDNNNTWWALVDSVAKVDDTTITSSITNPAGRMLQVFGRFNCRDDNLPVIGLDDFRGSRLFDESMVIFTSMTY